MGFGINIEKVKYMTISKATVNNEQLTVNGQLVKTVEQYKYLRNLNQKVQKIRG